MARIKISTEKDEPDEPEYEAGNDPEPDEDVEELAKDMAKDVADEVAPQPKEAPLTRPTVERADPDEDLNIDPDANYAKIALLRVSIGDDDGQTMDDWIDKVKDALKDATKNTTVLTKHRLVNGKQVSEHRYQEEL